MDTQGLGPSFQDGIVGFVRQWGGGPFSFEHARQHAQSAEFRPTYGQRAGIEGTIRAGVRAYGVRHSRYIDMPKIHLQAVATANALNVVGVLAWLDGKARETTRTSHFAASE